jgi:hypothetical protein
MDVIYTFFLVFSEHMNNFLEAEVSESKVIGALSSMQKGKILGPDDLTVEFFLGFYNTMKEDLLNVVRESQSFGKVL